MKKVLVWGAYNYGNFGDDLMAVAISRELRLMECDPVVFRLSDEIASVEGFCTIKALDDAETDIAGVVIGGGALLVNYSRDNEIDRRHYSDIIELTDFITKRRIPVLILSVGGSGLMSEPLPVEIQALFELPEVRKVTVRLESDKLRLGGLGERVEYAPDVVLLSANLLTTKVHKRKIRAVHLPDMLFFRALLRFAGIWHGLFTGIQLVPVGTYLRSHWGRLDELGVRRELGRTVRQGVYTTPTNTLSVLAQADLLVSYKLHLGVAAMSVGTPFFSYSGKRKTVGFMRSIGLGHRCISRYGVWRLMKSLLRLSAPEAGDIQETKLRARRHMDVLKEWVETLR